MSSIRVPSLAVSNAELKKLDDFMFTHGFDRMPGYDNKTEPANMPWSSRYYRHDTVMYTTGKMGTLHQTVDVAQWLYAEFGGES